MSLCPHSMKPTECVHCMSEADAQARVERIDSMFEDARGYGSWMIMRANEREAICDRFGWPHKYQARCNGERTD